MGWSGGTEIFDNVASQLLEINEKAYDSDLPLYRIYNVLSSLKDVLWNIDWDTENESVYWYDPVIGKMLGNEFEEDEDD